MFNLDDEVHRLHKQASHISILRDLISAIISAHICFLNGEQESISAACPEPVEAVRSLSPRAMLTAGTSCWMRRYRCSVKALLRGQPLRLTVNFPRGSTSRLA